MHELIVLSDLHMGRGINPETRRYYTLENFFFDDDFARFCDYLCRDAAARHVPFKLIFNGDTFDLLRIEPDPETPAVTRQDKRFGPAHTPQQAAHTVAQILAGHQSFVRGLAQVLNAGHEIVIMPGNHDIEVQWEPVHDAIRTALTEQVRSIYGEASIAPALALLRFEAWFYHEPNRVWIEHGCQYDPENSFRYLLRGKMALVPDAIHELEQDMPLGNFFQRYLYNAFGHITFIVPSTRANLRYVKWLMLHEPRLLLRVAFSHGPFVFQVLRRLSQQANTFTLRALQQAHDSTLAELAQKTTLGLKLLAIDQLKEVRADAVAAMRSLSIQSGKILASSLFGTLMIAGLWFFGFYSINELRVSFGPKALLFIVMDLITAGVTVAGALYLLFGSAADISPRPLRRAAQRIAAILDVPIVSFGHSHDEEVWRLERPSGGKGWYCNTGTWIAVFTHDVLIPRERVQYTFLRIRDDQADLLHWSPGRGEPMKVILLDEGDPLV
jgi:UDP-2,3-diacylglucosamine pyrophosphatase LpxH